MAPNTSIVFYDIAMRPPAEKNACSPNPWKARQALNFKGVPYTTTWVPLPEVANVRQKLQVPACRKFADGSDFYTLPIIEDPSTGTFVGDSYDIAVYLQKTYPDSGAGDLFPQQKLDYTFKNDTIPVPLSDIPQSGFPEYARFNVHVDALFSAFAQLTVACFPFDPATAEISKAEMARRVGVPSWDVFALNGEAREKTKDGFRAALDELGKLFLEDASGPFILGSRVTHADFIVGGWLHMYNACLADDEWQELRSWYDGLFGKLYDALEAYATMN
ncbi:hypothetical protein N7481_002260 [Penicillium waksmanii]|uniref:uncharacterized protein n=1 Tax=Penicillium waksmanii TaxID=69791 RepID=UPI002549BD4B|nr:uncharacterized protein N7481_002260 [Penicillium waksmanii]KAJ5995283.1 hypothetical protein N7481_002260 [Penicillium waksmanii]